MEITFHGAAGQVTGSMIELALNNGYKILIDCGLNYEKDVPREENANFPFNPKTVDVVLLTHAHLDHSGNLPTLFAAGFEGKVICTEPTWTLVDLLLTDSASIEAARIQKIHKRKRKSQESSGFRLYGHGDVRKVIGNMVTVPFGETFNLYNGVDVTFIAAGHILGAASLVIDVVESGKKQRLAFTGDLGNNGSLITVDPQIPQDVDVLVMESTYGSRRHVHFGDGESILKDHILETCVKKKGKLIVPAFSVGRTQAILYALNRLFKSGQLSNLVVFADSPMGITSSEIHANYSTYLNPNASQFLEKYHALFKFKELYIIEDKDDVAFMESFTEPCIIVSSAGMLEGGRIQHHIKFNILNPKCTILMAGYCTPNTLGHTLLSGAKDVSIKGKMYPVFAKIARTDAFSAHPDMDGLSDYHSQVAPKKTYLIHGDIESLQTFKNSLNGKSESVLIPEKGMTFVH